MTVESGGGAGMAYAPRIFIGSSRSGRSIAAALEMQLRPHAQCHVWWRDTFRLSRTTIEDLEKVARSEADCGVFVMTPDDIRDRGRGPLPVARDNILFELGLFMGALGRDRTFGVQCDHCAIDLPTDLLGITWATYADPHDDAESLGAFEALEALSRAVQPAAALILERLNSTHPAPFKASGSDDLVKAYAMRGLVTRPEWNATIDGRESHIWLYGMAEMGYADDDRVPILMGQAAQRGCDIKVLLLSPSYERIAEIDADEGNPPGTLAGRIRAGLSRFADMRRECRGRMQIRTYDSAPAVSIVRGDDRMLVTPYVRFLSGNNTPTLELQESGRTGMFERYERHFHRIWATAREWTD